MERVGNRARNTRDLFTAEDPKDAEEILEIKISDFGSWVAMVSRG